MYEYIRDIRLPLAEECMMAGFDSAQKQVKNSTVSGLQCLAVERPTFRRNTLLAF
jgi:hypothetical protein